MQDSLPLTIFQASLGTGSILFAVFSFLFTIFATMSTVSRPEDLNRPRPRVVHELRLLCRLIAITGVLNFLITLLSFISMKLSDVLGILLAGGISLVMLCTVAITI